MYVTAKPMLKTTKKLERKKEAKTTLLTPA